MISKVLPFPGNSGQQMRIKNMIESLKGDFHITFFTSAKLKELENIKDRLKNIVDDSIILETEYTGLLKKINIRIFGWIWTFKTGLKLSNYIIGEYDFTRKKLESVIQERKFDAVIYEYWHAHKTIDYFRQKKVPTVLDMHNILWKSYQSQIYSKNWLPRICKKWFVKRYRQYEEKIWNKFDGIISINNKENEYVINKIKTDCAVDYIPMGIDFNKWSVQRELVSPQRIGYYGGLGSIHNQNSAILCYKKIMPLIWSKLNDIELWLIGSNPPKNIRDLEFIDDRIKVTGYIEDVQNILKTISIIICPWNGTYGFRSRIIEIMALGLPIITTNDAISGMELKDSKGVYLSDNPIDYSNFCLRLLQNNSQNISDGIINRQYSKKIYSYEKTYSKTPQFINNLIKNGEGR